MEAPLFAMDPVEQLRHALREAFDHDDPLKQSVEDLAGDLLSGRRTGNAQRADKPDSVFFDNWFAERYFFLFKKNLSVTNIQFAELFALLRTHATYDGRPPAPPDRSPQLQLLSRDDFRELIGQVLRDLRRNQDTNTAIDLAAKTFLEVFDRTILVAPFHGSCALYLPPRLTLDIARICGESGYIHSCGKLVYLRNVEKASKEGFAASLRDHVDGHYTSGARATLIPYSHEAFSGSDEHERDMLSGGLDEVKLHATKYFVGSDSLVDVLTDLQERYGDRLWIPDPGPYPVKHDLDIRRDENADPTRTIWILNDREITAVPLTVRASRRFVVVYDQLYANKNRYQEFDENKPGWLDHTTLPHTLTGAMINITRPWDTNQVCIADPFAGSGTTLFEAEKLPGATAACSDASPIACQVVADNRAFFSQPVEWLRAYRAELKNVVDEVDQFEQHNQRKKKSALQTRYEWADALVHRCVQADGELVFAPADVADLKAADLRSRLLFYLLLKAERRNSRAFKSGDARWFETVKEQARRLGERVDALLRIDEGQEYTADPHVQDASEIPAHLCFVQTRYSVGITTRPPRLGVDEAAAPAMSEADARVFSGPCDVIVCDPPYGFNTEESVTSLGELYRETLERFLRSLPEGRDGHLVVCLPEQSFIGRGTPWFTRRNAYIRLVFALADRFGREVVRVGQVFPSHSRTAGPPYYWQSDRALRRAVVHFVFRPSSRRGLTSETAADAVRTAEGTLGIAP